MIRLSTTNKTHYNELRETFTEIGVLEYSTWTPVWDDLNFITEHRIYVTEISEDDIIWIKLKYTDVRVENT